MYWDTDFQNVWLDVCLLFDDLVIISTLALLLMGRKSSMGNMDMKTLM
jgi:hypothetical protein